MKRAGETLKLSLFNLPGYPGQHGGGGSSLVLKPSFKPKKKKKFRVLKMHQYSLYSKLNSDEARKKQIRNALLVPVPIVTVLFMASMIVPHRAMYKKNGKIDGVKVGN